MIMVTLRRLPDLAYQHCSFRFAILALNLTKLLAWLRAGFHKSNTYSCCHPFICIGFKTKHHLYADRAATALKVKHTVMNNSSTQASWRVGLVIGRLD